MKKIISMLLAIVMVFSLSLTAFAQGEGITYDCENGYTAVKLSNPELGSGEVDGLVGDRGQSYSWSSVGYGKYMYIGTCFGTIFQALNIIAREKGIDNSQVQDLINALFNGTLYAGEPGEDETPNRAYIIKIDTETMETTIVDGPTKLAGYRAATLFNDKIYFAASGAVPYLLEVDPATDETQIVYYGEKPTDPSVATGIRGITVYRDMLVATMIGDEGAYMVASKNPSEGQESFEVICTQEDLLDYPAYHFLDSIFGGSIYDIIEYNDKLYMTVVTGKNGDRQPFALFSGQPDENGEWSFDVIIGNEEDGAKYPFGLGCARSGAANIMVHDGYLYIGGYNDPMIALPDILSLEFENLYKDLSSPVCLWRLDENNDIEMVAGEPNEVFPDGPVGNMGAGFGSNTNQYVWRMESYNGQFYLGTFDMSSLLYPLMQFTNGDIFRMSKEEWESQIYYLKVLAASFGYGSADDETLVQVGSIGDFINSAGESTADEGIFGNSTFDEAFKDAIAGINKDKVIAQITELIDLLSQIDFDEIASEEYIARLTELLTKVSEVYEKIKDNLSSKITDVLDKLLAKENIENLKYFVKSCDYMRQATRGFDLFVSDDGVNFDTITTDGFGDPYNYGCRVFAITDNGLCIGTANPFYGTQVWRLDDGGQVDFELGDADENGELNIRDATLIQKHIAKMETLTEQGEINADVNFDGKITIQDATLIQKHLANMINIYG